MNWLVTLPLLVPLITAMTLLSLWQFRGAQRWLSVLGAAAHLMTAILLLVATRHEGVQASQMGHWPAPYGITLVADLFSAIMVVLAALMGFAVALYSTANIDKGREAYGYHPLFHFLLLGVCAAFLTGDMFNLYVAFEVMLMSSFVLLCLGGERGQIEGAIKYVTLNLISSAVFLAAVGILYGVTGTLNMADLSVKIGEITNPDHQRLMTILSMMFLVAFGVKAAIFPLFFWLPASYHTPPVAVSAIFAGLLTKVGVYALIRIFTLIFDHDVGLTHLIILILGGVTMLTGVLGAAAQNDFRRILSFHIISQIGYMVMGLGLMVALARSDTEETRLAVRLALAGSVFYIVHHIIVKTNLFLVSGVVERLQGTGDLTRLGGFYRAWPLLSVLFLIPALSLAGIPPLSGFWAKFVLIKAALQTEEYLITGTALFVGLLTLFSMTKIWAAVFWAEASPGSPMADNSETYQERRRGVLMMISPIVGLATITIAIGLGAEALFVLSIEAADQLLQPTAYIDAVLGDGDAEMAAVTIVEEGAMP